MFLKVCGITRAADAKHAVDEGATALGFVFWPRSPRYVTLAQAASLVADVPPGIATVGVFVNASPEAICHAIEETGITMAQLHGDEPSSYAEALPVPVLRAVTIDGFVAADRGWPASTMLLLDANDPERRGGTGTRVDWSRAAALAGARRIVLAGGLTPDNVAEAVDVVRPSGVDVSSGVEERVGVKDREKVSRFLAAARRAFASVDRARVAR